MFRRRQKRSWMRRLRELLWPSVGWHRSMRYTAHRIGRLPGSPYSIAAGFASGAAVSMTPFLGFHFAGAALLAWVLRGSIMASAIGTIVGNPWTFPFIFLWTYKLGNWMMGEAGMVGLPHALTFDYLLHHPGQVLLPMAVGCLPTAVVAWFAFYIPTRLAVAGYQRARQYRRSRRQRIFRPGPSGEIKT